jgi:hypothetical protein
MENGIARFNFYIVQLEDLLLKASREKNPALWLYNNDARTILFMLESMAKLYGKIHNEKRFSKIKEHFKELEDSLGAIDYYNAFAKEFAGNAAIPAAVTEYLQAQAREKTQHLNDMLSSKKWIGAKEKRLKKIWEKLADADWQKPVKEIKSILGIYLDAIEDIKVLVLSASKGFTELENELHEFRRKLRWLSIYPQSLQGAVQLTDSQVMDDDLATYLTPEIVHSPFNKMPDAGNNTAFLLLEKNYFLALSWMIAALGRLKDDGLRFFAIAEALQQTEQPDHSAAMQKAMELTNAPADSLQQILAEANAIVKKYFDAQYLDKMIHGIAIQEKKKS